MNIIPRDYMIQKFCSYTRRSSYKSSTNTYNAECAACHEGKSKGKKRRLHYIIDEDFLICYNCGKAWSPLQWLKEITGLTFQEIKREIEEGNFSTIDAVLENNVEFEKKTNPFTLPQDCINLFDPQQLEFYKTNDVIKDALAFIKHRRLDTAINRCDKLWISLKDYIHKNRIIIPFSDPDNQIRFYQSRAIYQQDEEIAKYFSKINAEKTLYGLKNISTELDYIFLFEGPIDSMFVQNGLGITGLKLTAYQEKLLQKYSMFKKIWVLDNQLDNKDVFHQYQTLIDSDERVFIWPDKLQQFKDLNEVCIKMNRDSVHPNFLINNSFKGAGAHLKLGNSLRT